MVRISPACGPLGVLTIVLFGTAAPCRADNPATAAVPAQAPGPFNPGLEAGPGQPGGPEEHTLSISTPSAGDPACSWTAPQPGDCRASTGQVWASADYLLWWITKGPLNDPLVTRGNPADTHPGAIGQPGTSVLFGGQGLDFNSFSGGRVTLGGWLDADQRFGAEGSGFFLEDRALGFAAAGDANGNPPIYVPLFRRPGTGRVVHRVVARLSRRDRRCACQCRQPAVGRRVQWRGQSAPRAGLHA